MIASGSPGARRRHRVLGFPGGQLMPPVMGVAAFLMAEFLGKSYFDVVARGYARPSFTISGQRRRVPDLDPFSD